MAQAATLSSIKMSPKPSMNGAAATAAAVKSEAVPPPWAHLLAGASGGLATAILTSPLDVLRTRLQSDFYRQKLHTSPPPGPPADASILPKSTPAHRINSTGTIVSSILREEGWRGFFRGLGPSMSGVVPATAMKFYVYGNAKRIGARLLGMDEKSALVHAAAAVTAGIATGTATNPIWLVKTRLQLDQHRKNADGTDAPRRYRNSLDCTRQVVRQEGVKGLYRGLSASYLGTMETALHLVLYEQLKTLSARTLTKYQDGESSTSREVKDWVGTSGAAGTAKLLATVLTYPHEVIRTRLRQAPMENGHPKYTSIVQCFKLIRVEEGWAGLYGGLTPHLMRSIPSAIITLGVYEFVLRMVQS